MVEAKGFGAIIFAFIALIIGISFLTSMGNTVSPLVQAQTVRAESFTWEDNITNITLAHGNMTNFINITNGTSLLVAATNYTVFTTEGIIQVDASNASSCLKGDVCLANYDYNANSYIEDGGARSVTSLVILMFALAVMAAVMAFVFPGFDIFRKK